MSDIKKYNQNDFIKLRKAGELAAKALKYIEDSLDYIDQIDDKLSKIDSSTLEKPKILTYSKIKSHYE